MTLPKAQEKAKYDQWAGEVAIEGYNDGKYGRSFIGAIEGEKTWFNPGKQLKVELQKGNVYNIKMSRKVGSKGWYVTDAELVAGETKEVPTTTKKVVVEKAVTKTEPVKEINGQAKGNYRTGLMAFICTHYQIKQEFPDDELLERFNQLIKVGENSFWNAESDIDTTGLIE